MRLFALLSALALSAPAAAAGFSGGWRAVIAEHGSIPAYIVAVDKSKQELAFFERRSPLRLARVFACTTGQATGDKEVQGDLKTPEGIYFVGHRIGSGLDFIKYGHEAYTLNYPNPVDRLRRKTGYGIWIHGRGEPLTPLQTEGCVSLNNEDLTTLSKALTPGTPVALAGSLAFAPAPHPDDARDAALLEQKVRDWAELWSARSKRFFDLYNAEAYSLATESFSAFRAQKERLFGALPWIRTTVRDVQSLKGPGYWVTWFYQEYQAPNLSTRGVRRLYWSKDKAGEFRILGMEWQPGLDTSILLASAEPLLPEGGSDAGPVWPEHLRLTAESGGARRDGPGAGNTPAEAATSVAPAVAPAPPVPPVSWTPPLPEEEKNTEATAAPEVHGTASPSAAAQGPAGRSGGPESAGSAPAAAEERTKDLPRPSPAAFALAERMNKKPLPATPVAPPSPEAAPRAEEKSRVSTDGHSQLNLPPALPSQGLAGGGQASAPAQVAAARDAAPGPSGQAPVVAAAPAPGQTQAAESAPQEARSLPAPPAAGAASGAAVGSAETGAEREQSSLAELAELVQVVVENWRHSWESGDVDAYMAFYAPHAEQGRRSGVKSIRRQKERLWSRVPPARVLLEDVRVKLDGDALVADMRQEYRDASGGGDIGMKTLTFRKINGAWLIIREDWKALTDETGN